MSVEQLNEYLKGSKNPPNPVILDSKVAMPETDGISMYWVLVANQSDTLARSFKKRYHMMTEHFNNMVSVLKQGDSVQAVVRYHE